MPAFLYTIFISIFNGKYFPPACAGQWQLPAAPVQVPLPGRAGHPDSVGNDMAWGMEPARALLPWQEHLLAAEKHKCVPVMQVILEEMLSQSKIGIFH